VRPCRAAAGDAVDGRLGARELEPTLLARERRGRGRGTGERLVVVGVVDDLVAVGGDGVQQVAVRLRPEAGDAEGRADVVVAQRLEDRGRGTTVGASVEGEGDDAQIGR